MRVLFLGTEAVKPLADALASPGWEIIFLYAALEDEQVVLGDADALVFHASAESFLGTTQRTTLLNAAHERQLPSLWINQALPEAFRGSARALSVQEPVAGATLRTLLETLQRAIGLQARNDQLQHQVQCLKDVVDGEHRMARRMLDQFINAEQLSDQAIRYWNRPADVFGGDILLAARTPANVLHIMMVDDMYRGTVAAVSALPVVAPFYRMTEKGFSIDAIVREANSRIFRFYPDGHSVATTLVSVDFGNGVIHVWNGGTPPPILLGPDGTTLSIATPRPALGGVGPAQFEVTTDIWVFQDDGFLALASIGLLRKFTADAKRGELPEAFQKWLVSADLQRAIPKDVPGLLPGIKSTDDMSLLVVNCSRTGSLVPEPSLMPMDKDSTGEWTLSLVIGPREMRTVDMVPLLLGVVGQFETTQELGGTIFVILSELYNNALDHGVLKLDSSLKLGVDGMGAFLDARAQRLAALAEGEIELTLKQRHEAEGAVLAITCRDSGTGFDLARLQEPVPSQETDLLPYGRGLALVASLTRRMSFNPAGNQVEVVLPLVQVKF